MEVPKGYLDTNPTVYFYSMGSGKRHGVNSSIEEIYFTKSLENALEYTSDGKIYKAVLEPINTERVEIEKIKKSI